ncbi:hypothetical protein ACKAV7_009762 [Fusarium commune]|uniref:Nitrilase n=1 Tax=Fusarium oxysporum f. sp. rapae TaxID=485398 RepID=A0A8J5NT70_FUSOX|nr:Nitrilase [Fusarium oxysporum f. sp. rapae]KAI7767021.1 hypothetical protein LZL87_013487 [Fusarium oxysporum]
MDANPTPNSSNDKQGKVRVYVIQRCPRLLDLEHGVQTAIGEIATAANGDAHGLRAYDTTSGRIGAAVCWEHFHPLIRQALHTEDEQIHIALWPDMPSAHQIASRQYAFEGRCFFVAAASYLDKESVPPELLEAYVARTAEGHIREG